MSESKSKNTVSIDDLKNSMREGVEEKGPLEMLLCAKVNFENVENMAPVLKGHPIWQIAKSQLDVAVEGFEKAEMAKWRTK